MDLKDMNSENQIEVFYDPIIDMTVKKKNNQKRKFKKRMIIIVLLFAAIVSLSGIVVYKYIEKNPTEIVKIVIDNTYENFSVGLKKLDNKQVLETMNILEDNFKISGNINIRDKKNKELEKENIAYVLGFDYKNKKAEANISLLKDSNTIADFSIYCKHDNIYYLSETMFDNIYNLGKFDFYTNFNLSEFENELNNQNQVKIDDINYIIEQFKNALVDSLDKDKMTISKEKIIIGNDQVDTEKITYDLDYQSINDLYNKTFEKILDDENTIDKIALITGKTKEEVKDNLSKSALNEYNKEKFNNLKFSLYTMGVGHKLVKLELINEEYAFETSFLDNQINISSISNDNRIDMIIVKNEKAYDITIKKDSILIATFNIKELSKEVLSLDYAYKYEKIDVKGSINFISNKNSYLDYEIDFSIDGKINNQTYNHGINFTFKIEKDVEVASKDVSSSVESSTILEEDKYKMAVSLMELQKSEMYKYFMKSAIASNTQNNKLHSSVSLL